MTPIELALALALAQVSVNEAGFDSPADIALVYQATEAHGSTPAARLAWLRSHSSCVLGDDDPSTRPGNCAWTRNLRWNEREPKDWPTAGPPWSHYRDRWNRVRRFAAALVAGRVTRRPCEGRVVTWGSAEDAPSAIARGLRPLRCDSTHNIGFARAARGGES